MQIRILDRFSTDLDEVALESPQSTFYHTGVWVESLSRVYSGMKFRCLVAEEGGRVLGYLPFFVIRRGPTRALWSLPFGTYGGPVGGDDVRAKLLAKYSALRRGWGVREVGLVDYSNTVTDGVFDIDQSATHVLDLTEGFESIWDGRFDKSKRRPARKARREGLSVVEAGSVTDVGDYYAIYDERSRQWGQRGTLRSR
ncbi:MAG: hypothetical protein P8181_13530 [bacterium]